MGSDICNKMDIQLQSMAQIQQTIETQNNSIIKQQFTMSQDSPNNSTQHLSQTANIPDWELLVSVQNTCNQIFEEFQQFHEIRYFF